MEILTNYFSCHDKWSLLVFVFKETHYTDWTESTEARYAVTNVKGINILKVKMIKRDEELFCEQHPDISASGLCMCRVSVSGLKLICQCADWRAYAWSSVLSSKWNFNMTACLPLKQGQAQLLCLQWHKANALWPHKDNASHEVYSARCSVSNLVLTNILDRNFSFLQNKTQAKKVVRYLLSRLKKRNLCCLQCMQART